MITNEDNMELMARYPDGYFDLAIVDPPYGINMDGGQIGYSKHKKKNWDSCSPPKDYFNELFRVSKNQIIWGFNHFLDKLPNTKAVIFWNKHQNGYFAEGELAWCSIGTVKYYDRPYQKDIGNKIHPTQKPVKLYEWLLMNYATCKTCKNQGGYYEDVAGDGGSQMWQVCDDCDTHERPVRILDTHLGSGSIAIACHNLGFELTACELDTDYYNEAIKRINEHKQQTRLF